MVITIGWRDGSLGIMTEDRKTATLTLQWGEHGAAVVLDKASLAEVIDALTAVSRQLSG